MGISDQKLTALPLCGSADPEVDRGETRVLIKSAIRYSETVTINPVLTAADLAVEVNLANQEKRGGRNERTNSEFVVVDLKQFIVHTGSKYKEYTD